MSRFWLALFLGGALLPMSSQRADAATTVVSACGQTVTRGRAILASDLDCRAYPGVSLRLDKAQLHLRGFTLQGPLGGTLEPEAAGLAVVSCTNCRIRGPGTIAGGDVGLAIHSKASVSNLTIRDAFRQGILAEGSVRMRGLRLIGNGRETGSCGLAAPGFRVLGRDLEVRGNGCGIRSRSVRLVDAIIEENRTEVSGDYGSSGFGVWVDARSRIHRSSLRRNGISWGGGAASCWGVCADIVAPLGVVRVAQGDCETSVVDHALGSGLCTMDGDMDGDGTADSADKCPYDAACSLADIDGDQIGDCCDTCPTDSGNSGTDDGGASGTCRPSPNVLVIVGDDIGWSDYGFQGGPGLTPSIDSLAADGVVFQQMHLPSSVCTPTHFQLLGGYHPVVPFSPLVEPSLPAKFSAAGYDTWQAGKLWRFTPTEWGFADSAGNQAGPIALTGSIDWGRKDWDVARCGSAAPQLAACPATRDWRDFLSESGREAPFFALLTPQLPHTPFDPPAEYLAMFPGMSDTQRTYLAMLFWFDNLVGEVLSELHEAALPRETLIVYFADNGWQRMAGPLQPWAPETHRAKFSLYELGFRTPLIFSGLSDLDANHREDLVSLGDLHETLLASGPGSNEQHGFELRSAMVAEIPSPREAVVTYFASSNLVDGYVVRTPSWRYIRDEKNGRQELFAIAIDPHEEQDRFPTADLELIESFEAMIDNWLGETFPAAMD